MWARSGDGSWSRNEDMSASMKREGLDGDFGGEDIFGTGMYVLLRLMVSS